jgi:hypothetical protein
MRETTALIKSFDTDDTELINEFETKAEDKFILPSRNWNRLIDDYNIANKKKFKLDALDCRTILEYAKQGIPPKHVFEACGVSNAEYAKMYMQAQEAEDKLQELNAKEFLTDDEFDLFQVLLRLPVRVLMVDVSRAEGISKLMDWEQFNKNAKDHAEVQFAKMKARFKDYFADKNTEAPNYNVTIALGGDFISNL